MREILFRGKQTKHGEWIEGSLIIDERGNCYIGEYIKKAESLVIEGGRMNGKTINRFLGIGFVMVIPETVGQFTGLTENGKKIFEGDIVNIKYLDTTVKNAVIEYVGASFVGSTYADNWELDGYYSLEVIGNIHDTPELLEV